MKSRNSAIALLLFLVTCSEHRQNPNSTSVEATPRALGTVPPGEVAVWQKIGTAITQPSGRYLQAAAFDETRRLVVMFGGTNENRTDATGAANQETWEWSPATGKWANRTGTGAMPSARAGAAMVFDSARGKIVLFGGSVGNGTACAGDTWEWDPTTGVWTEISVAGARPSTRCYHGMVFEKSNGKILLFGGESSDPGLIGGTWEYEPTTSTWTSRGPTYAPSVRSSFGLVWDSARAKAVLFGGGSWGGNEGEQDIWEWDPTAGTWTERTTAGVKPTRRYGHAMAYDGSRKMVVVFGGYAPYGNGTSLNDLWDWEPITGTWTQRLTGAGAGIPSPRAAASLVSDDAGARLELVAGVASAAPSGAGGTGGGGATGGGNPVTTGTSSREVWELDPALPAFADRTLPPDALSARLGHAMAFSPATGKTYLFGGSDLTTNRPLDDLRAWDGKTWTLLRADVRPPARQSAALAYDPARKSLVLYGGDSGDTTLDDTWEWGPSEKWTQLTPASSPNRLLGPAMATDTTRGKVLLFGARRNDSAPMDEQMGYEIWEWDGATMTWSNRTPPASVGRPSGPPLVAYDEGRRKLFLYQEATFDDRALRYWEWDPLTAGWAMRNTGDSQGYTDPYLVVYDSIRRREVLLFSSGASNSGMQETWEIDARIPTVYVRTPANSPGSFDGPPAAVFDGLRGVVMLVGLPSGSRDGINETWEYKVSNLGNGEGCTPAYAASCASGNCTDGVCCAVAACASPCTSCNVAGAEGTCAQARAGTAVAGSCAAGQACDGAGSCKIADGQPCTVGTTCASGFCADGVCCDAACTGTCMSCSQAGRVGACAPYPAGTDPQAECGQGTGVCKSTCDGVGSCAFPSAAMTCAAGQICDGSGSCKLRTGQPCAIDATCASGFCVDGVCCESACTGTCMSCNQADLVGTCALYPSGSDPESECGQGSGACKSTCGTGSCVFPTSEICCGDGLRCDGMGSCSNSDLSCHPADAGSDGGSGGRGPNVGDAAGSIPNVGGAAGGIGNLGGAAGGGSDAAGTKLKRSGCACALGRGARVDPRAAVPIAAAMALLLWRRRRRARLRVRALSGPARTRHRPPWPLRPRGQTRPPDPSCSPAPSTAWPRPRPRGIAP